MKMRTMLMMTAPVLLIAGMPTAEAGTLDDFLCRFFGWGCTHGTGGGAVSVAEPEIIAMFSAGLIAAGIAAYRRRKS